MPAALLLQGIVRIFVCLRPFDTAGRTQPRHHLSILTALGFITAQPMLKYKSTYPF
jgi:hypothetical protein